MAADSTTVLQRVTEILNACAPGTFSATVDSNNKHRNASAISEAHREAAMDILRAIASNPNHVHRGILVSSSPTALTHGGELPDMAGEGDLVEIQIASGDPFIVGTPRTAQEIDSYRSNVSSLYNSVSHTTANSPLGGCYDISQGRIRFTGTAAQMYHPVISRTTATTLVPDEYEGTWVKLTVGYCLKEGDNLLPVGMAYYNWGMADLELVASMGTVPPVPPVERAMQARSDV